MVIHQQVPVHLTILVDQKDEEIVVVKEMREDEVVISLDQKEVVKKQFVKKQVVQKEVGQGDLVRSIQTGAQNNVGLDVSLDVYFDMLETNDQDNNHF